ncbi:MAG: hypothetical protein Q9M33_02580 [Robiginitomaculum sp.]|nr:hypothetical protein [Robiginitomaculum sp.]MDQ7077253.1 hypothetical protein [Robiginitomaculum sp.]
MVQCQIQFIGRLFVSLVMGFAIASPALSQGTTTQGQIDRLKNYANRVERDHKTGADELRRLFEEKAEIVRSRARAKGDLWYKEGLRDYDQDDFQRLARQLDVLHTLQKLDYSKTRGMLPILAKRIVGLDIVYKGKVEKEKFISKATMKGIAKENFRDQLMGNLYGTYMKAMAEPTPAAARATMMNFRDFIESIAATDSVAIDLETQKIQSEMDHFIVSLIPGVGEALALVEAYHGTSALGEKLTWVDQTLAVVGVVGAVADVASVVKTVGKFPAKAGQTLNLMSGYIADLSTADKAFIKGKYGENAVESLQNLRNKVKGLRTPQGKGAEAIVDLVDPKGMQVARISAAEKAEAATKLSNVSPKELQVLKTQAAKVVDESMPGLRLDKLSKPETMTELDYRKFQKSFGLDDVQMARIKKNPELLIDTVEQSTGVPFESLKVQANATKPGEYAVMRNTNADGLNDLKGGKATAKPLFVKSKSGVGGAVYNNQEFSKMSLELDAAERAGDGLEASKIRHKMKQSSRLVEEVTHAKEIAGLERTLGTVDAANNAEYAAKLQQRIDLLKSTRRAEESSVVDGKTLVAVMTENDKGNAMRSVMLKDDKGNLFDVMSKQPVAKEAHIIKNADGSDKVLSRVVDKNSKKYFVGDSDPHMIALSENSVGKSLSFDPINGTVTRAEQEYITKMALQSKAQGLEPTILHAGQVRYVDHLLDTDKKLFVIENGVIRIIKDSDSQLGSFVHSRRLNGNLSNVDPRWQWGQWTPEGGFQQ